MSISIIKHNHRTSMLLLSVLAVICDGNILANESVLEAKPIVEMEIKILGDKFSGKFVKVPIKKVLDEFRSRIGVTYNLKDDLADFKISQQFENVTQNQMFKILLEPFNYLMTSDRKGNIKKLSVTSIKNEETNQGQPLVNSFIRNKTDKDLNELAKFIPLVTSTGPDSDAEISPIKLPEFTPQTNKNGPPTNQSAAIKLPEFSPVVSKTGPIAERK